MAWGAFTGHNGQGSAPELIYIGVGTGKRWPERQESIEMGCLKFIFQAFMGMLTLWLVHRSLFRGAYWRWRSETAFGNSTHKQPRRWVRIRAILAFAVWSWQMRRI